jgi:hypothetical protein
MQARPGYLRQEMNFPLGLDQLRRLEYLKGFRLG